MSAIFAGQVENGSWDDSVVKTAYGILRALSIQIPPDDARIQKAAQWLLDWPEPVGRPGMWMQAKEHILEWNAIKNGEVQTDRDSYFNTPPFTEEDYALCRGQEQQQVIPTCPRNNPAGCHSRILHPSATVADALCRCGYADHPRVRDYANTILQVGGMFGYFCSCWGIADFGVDIEDLRGNAPDFNQRTEEHEIALKSIPYGYARDEVDLLILARHPQYPGVHRPDLADTNGWVPYEWKEIGIENHFALVGSYWQNGDCWAKTNRALSQFPTWSGTIAEFFALFQCHLYQTPLGEWNQGFPAGIFRWIAEVTRTTRAKHSFEDSSLLRFAKLITLKTVPWLREHQKEDGLWHHNELPRFGGGKQNRPPSSRLGTYQKFRDYQKDAEAIVHILKLGPQHTVIDMGAGTGAFVLHAAGHCKMIYAVDVSRPMLDYACQKAEKAGLGNIVFCHGGFLTYEHDAEPADALVCIGVLHHLPDFWKLIGLKRTAGMIKPGGKLYLFDVVFPADMTDYKERFDDWVQSTGKNISPDFASEVETTIRDEYSTYDWIMEGFLERAGFRIDSAEYTDGFGVKYVCTKQT